MERFTHETRFPSLSRRLLAAALPRERRALRHRGQSWAISRVRDRGSNGIREWLIRVNINAILFDDAAGVLTAHTLRERAFVNITLEEARASIGRLLACLEQPKGMRACKMRAIHPTDKI